MTTDNTSNPLNPLPLLSQEMERTLRRLAWKDEIFQDALIADPKGIIQYLFHQSLPNGKLPDDLTIKVIEEDPYTHHIVLPPLPDEEPTLEIPEEEQLDLVINLGDGGKRPRESKESEQSNGAKGEREPSWHEREVKRKKADEQDAKVPTKTEVAKALSKAMHEDQKIRQAVKKALDTDGNLNSAIQMMQDKGYLSGFKLPKDVNYKRLQNTEGTYHLVLQSSRNASGVPELDHEAIAKQPNKNMANSDIATRCGDYCNPDNTRNACGN